MTHNIFQFGDTFWAQQIGTAMGTPVACIYATIFFAWFEKTYILPKFKDNLLFYVRQIDDILGVWIDSPFYPKAWTDFQNDIQSRCQLNWIFTPLQNSVNFLDLTVSINPLGVISTKTFQKSTNLFQYICPHSSHPPSITNSLIYGLLQTYFRQNSETSEFLNMTKLLFRRLKARGHPTETLTSTFQNAVAKIAAIDSDPFIKKPPNVKQSPQEQLFLHLPYHPRDISRKSLRDIYEATCEEPSCFGTFKSLTNEQTGGNMSIDKLTICYHRPKNLRDILSPTTLKDCHNSKVSSFAPTLPPIKK